MRGAQKFKKSFFEVFKNICPAHLILDLTAIPHLFHSSYYFFWLSIHCIFSPFNNFVSIVTTGLTHVLLQQTHTSTTPRTFHRHANYCDFGHTDTRTRQKERNTCIFIGSSVRVYFDRLFDSSSRDTHAN